MKTFVRIAFKFFLFVFGFYYALLFCKKQTDGFQLFKIKSELTYHPEWQVSHTESEIEAARAALDQPYYYLAKGAQSYVFISKDQQYVLKFFRQHHLRPSIFVRLLPPFGDYKTKIEAKIARKNQEMQTDFNSYKIAYDHLKEETGLVYVHLNKGTELGTKINVIDKLNIAHPLDMDKMEFLLQKKAALLYDEVDQLIKEEQMGSLKLLLKDLVEVIKKRCKLGIFDKDPDLNTNFGVIDHKPIQIDVGRFRWNETEKEPSIYQKELFKITEDLRHRIEKTHPEVSKYLESLIDRIENGESCS